MNPVPQHAFVIRGGTMVEDAAFANAGVSRYNRLSQNLRARSERGSGTNRCRRVYER
jgi:hypothetical protein